MSEKSVYILIALGLVLWLVFGRKDNTWRGFYYEGGSFASVVYSPEYKTKEDCIAWGENERQRRPSDSSIDPQNLYECGKNCKVQNKEVGLHVCEVTFDGGDWRRGDYGD